MRPTLRWSRSPLAGVARAVILACAVSTSYARDVSMEQRVDAELALQRVYWTLRSFPTDNAQSRPGFEAVLPKEAATAKVVDYLRKGKALEDLWGVTISADLLQAEMRRMTRSSQSPEVLKELFSALGNDPLLIAECLARPAVTDRFIRDRYGRDRRLHAEARKRAENALATINGAGAAGALVRADDLSRAARNGGIYREVVLRPRRSSKSERGSEFSKGPDPSPSSTSPALVRSVTEREWRSLRARLAEPLGHSPLDLAKPWIPGESRFEAETALSKAVADKRAAWGVEEDNETFSITGVLEVTDDLIKLGRLSWSKVPFDTWWRQARERHSSAMSTPRGSYEAVASNPEPCTDDTWRSMSSRPPHGRSDHVAVWTGAEMIVWGGFSLFGSGRDGR